MLKVLHVISRLDIGGAEKVALNIAKSKVSNIEYHIVEVAKATSAYSEQYIREAEGEGIIVHRSNITNLRIAMITFPLRLRRILKDYRPDIIHTHTEVPDMAIFLSSLLHICNKKRIRFVRTIHNNQLWNGWKKIGNFVEDFLKKNASIVAISKSTQDSYLTNYKLKCPIIYNGVEVVDQYEYPGIIKDRVNIIFVGRMEYQKGIDIMIDVVSHFGNDDRFHFHIIGIGTESDKVKARLSKFDNVTLSDRIVNLANYLGSFDYLFMPSLFEGLALTPIEAALAGTPTIINDAKGLSEVFPKDWPLKVNNNNYDSFITIFENLLNNDYASIQSLAREYVLKMFSIETMRSSYENTYYEICR